LICSEEWKGTNYLWTPIGSLQGGWSGKTFINLTMRLFVLIRHFTQKRITFFVLWSF